MPGYLLDANVISALMHAPLGRVAQRIARAGKAMCSPLRTGLERTGKPIGANDMLIAAHALALDATLVTDNLREFGRVEGLATENWLR
jgi:predicted nucleic acid-binding protein